MEQLARILGRLPQGMRSDRTRTGLARAVWKRVAGEALASHSRVTAVRRGCLEVAADDEVWARELTTLSATLVSRLRTDYPGLRLRRLNVHADPTSATPAVANGTEPAARTAPGSKEIRRRSETIRDPALRAALLRTAEAYLARSRRRR
jgi:hypothetical protein